MATLYYYQKKMSSYIVKKLQEDKRRKEQKKKGITITTKKFDVEAFDQKVAESVYKIHRDVYRHKAEQNYEEWCVNNLEHLDEMYNISELVCDFNTFCSFVYYHSDQN